MGKVFPQAPVLHLNPEYISRDAAVVNVLAGIFGLLAVAVHTQF